MVGWGYEISCVLSREGDDVYYIGIHRYQLHVSALMAIFRLID